MEVIERKENPLLDRVEIRFMWNHENSPTPSLNEMVAAATISFRDGVGEFSWFHMNLISTRSSSGFSFLSMTSIKSPL